MRSARLRPYLSGSGLVAAIAASLILAGCSGSSVDPAKPRATKGTGSPAATKPAAETIAAAPKVGDCWNSTRGHLVGVSFGDDAAVACNQKHNAVTYRIGTLPSGLTYAKIVYDRLSGIKVVTDTCNNERASRYLGHGDLRPPLRLDNVFFAPSRQQWAAGARWFRCDLGFPDIISDSTKRLDWQPLPADLRAAVDKDDGPFVACSNGSVKRGPFQANSTTGKCGRGMHWLHTSFLDIAKRPREGYPGNKVVRRRAWDACDSRLHRWADWPERSAWNKGDTRANCWVEWSAS
jgi:hypothetical protein